MKKLPAPIERVAYTPAEAAAACGVGPDFFEEHLASRLRWVRLGNGSRVKRLVAKSELERLIDELAEDPMTKQINPKGVMP